MSELYDIHEYDISVDTRTIYLSGSASSEDDYGIDFRSSLKFIKNINYLNNLNNSPITIHVKSSGGSWDEGMAIYDAIKLSASPCLLIGHSNVASMNTIILQAADYRFMMPNAFLMIHEGSFQVNDNSKVVYSNAMRDRENYNDMLEIYCKKTILSESFKSKKLNYIKKYYDNNINSKRDWFISLYEAKNLNLIDEVFSEVKYKNIIKNLKKIKNE